jgi:hypothetical protein
MMRLRASSLLFLLLSVSGCPWFPGDFCGETPGVCSGDASSDAPKDGITVDVKDCDLSKDPKDSPKCVDDQVGVFVSPMGSDSAPGTKAMPVQTIGKGFDLAKMKSLPRVYVCTGTYGPLALDDKRDGIAAFGGFDCAMWSPGSAPTLIKSNDNKPALIASSLTNGVSLVDLQLQAQDASVASDSSVGAQLANATLTLRRCKVEVGKGASAIKLADPMDFSPASQGPGDNGKMNAGGQQTPNNCANGSGNSIGGAGGQPNVSGDNGKNGTPFMVYPINPNNATGAGGNAAAMSCGAGSSGLNGSYGPGGTTGGAGAAKLGTLDMSGWHAEPGGAGAQGKVGQGGGGGASLDNAGGGGGGGPGGCGGDGGKGGAGGGASIAIASFQATLNLNQTTLISKNAGDGAQGQAGQKAQGGGNGGIQFSGECGGGNGGHGGSGAGGGGGSGGVTIGIAYSGSAPTIDGMSVMDAMTNPNITLGTPGMAGASGQGAPAFKMTAPLSNPGANGTAGIAGLAQAVKAF